MRRLWQCHKLILITFFLENVWVSANTVLNIGECRNGDIIRIEDFSCRRFQTCENGTWKVVDCSYEDNKNECSKCRQKRQIFHGSNWISSRSPVWFQTKNTHYGTYGNQQTHGQQNYFSPSLPNSSSQQFSKIGGRSLQGRSAMEPMSASSSHYYGRSQSSIYAPPESNIYNMGQTWNQPMGQYPGGYYPSSGSNINPRSKGNSPMTEDILPDESKIIGSATIRRGYNGINRVLEYYVAQENGVVTTYLKYTQNNGPSFDLIVPGTLPRDDDMAMKWVESKYQEYMNSRNEPSSVEAPGGSPWNYPISGPPRHPCFGVRCGFKEKCSVEYGEGKCICTAAHIGSPPYCRPRECMTDFNCKAHQNCVDGECKDECERGCGLGAQCSYQYDHPVCVCLEGLTGNPRIECTLSDTLKPEAPLTTTTTESYLPTTIKAPVLKPVEPGPVPKILPKECGLSGIVLRNKIVGGTNATIEDNPWQVALLDKTFALKCGGSIISPRHVLTAAHCFLIENPKNRNLDVAVSKDDRLVLAGRTNVSEHEQLYKVSQLILHAKYKNAHRRNDIALLVIDGEFTFTSQIYPICIPTMESAAYEAQRVCKISGWGRTQADAHGVEKMLRSASVRLTTPQHCKQNNEDFTKISEGMFCAGDFENGGIDTCSGDSGGPLSCSDKGLTYLYGITSFGIGCGRAKHPGVYAKVARYREWINKKLELSAGVQNRDTDNYEEDEDVQKSAEVEDESDEDVV